MKLGRKGQSAWFDILVIFLSLMLFTGLLWAYTHSAKSPGTHNQMRMQDYTRSMFIRTLYTTYTSSDPADTRYLGKSVSDLMGMYISNKKAFVLGSDGQPLLLKAALEEVVKSDPKTGIKWFIYEADGDNKMDFCFFVHDGLVDRCPSRDVPSNVVTTDSAEIYYVQKGLLGFGGGEYVKKNVKIEIIWDNLA